jgi:hypothetical protein
VLSLALKESLWTVAVQILTQSGISGKPRDLLCDYHNRILLHFEHPRSAGNVAVMRPLSGLLIRPSGSLARNPPCNSQSRSEWVTSGPFRLQAVITDGLAATLNISLVKSRSDQDGTHEPLDSCCAA